MRNRIQESEFPYLQRQAKIGLWDFLPRSARSVLGIFLFAEIIDNPFSALLTNVSERDRLSPAASE